MDRAVIYCRVSTEEERQLNALEKQIDEARTSVVHNDWLLVDEYVDEGKSGTMTKHRDEFLRLSDDIETDKFDVIVVKSQDRLMRSTRDWYLFVDKIVQNRKKLFFYLENKFYNTDDALLTGIRAILAEEYSRELSKKLNNAHRYRQKNKGKIILTNMTWGYDNVDKKIVVNEDEAEMVRMIYELSAQGYGSRSISKILSNRGYLSRTGKPFSDVTIVDIIRNPLFKGTAVMNKVHYDFNTKKSIYNDKSEWIYKENAVPPIVNEELWDAANRMMDQRVIAMTGPDDEERKFGKYWGKFPLSAKIICGECGSTYWIRKYYRKEKQLIKVWSCSQYIRYGRLTKGHSSSPKWKLVDSVHGCDNIHLNYDDLNKVLLDITESLCFDKKSVKRDVQGILKQVFKDQTVHKTEDIENQLSDIAKKKEILLDAFLDNMIDNSIYKKKEEKLTQQENQLKIRLSREKNVNALKYDVDNRIKKIEKEIDQIIDEEVALSFICRHINQITVYRDQLNIDFDIFPKCFIEVKQVNYRNKQMTIHWDELFKKDKSS